MNAFPKSHIVTFKYYVGVILFLEEDYVKVFGPDPPTTIIYANVCMLPGRQKSI